MSNVYSDMVSYIREQGAVNNDAPMELGKVISVSPLTVLIGELQLTKEDILVNYDTLKEITYNGTVLKEGLKADDLVVMQPINSEQDWILMCKVVKT